MIRSGNDGEKPLDAAAPSHTTPVAVAVATSSFDDTVKVLVVAFLNPHLPYGPGWNGTVGAPSAVVALAITITEHNQIPAVFIQYCNVMPVR